MIRFIYFIYYLKNIEWARINKFQNYTYKARDMNKISQWISVFWNSMRYNISILEYYQFRFFEKNSNDKLEWAGTGYMYEYQRIMNPPKKRYILDDKREFYNKYHEFFVHHVFSLEEILMNPSKLQVLFQSKKIVFKMSNGKCGVNVRIVSSDSIEKEDLIKYMRKHGFDMVETFLEQHIEMQRLSPSAVNTVRIFTQLTKNNDVVILGCRQRISIDCSVDNMAAGNVAAAINEETGVIEGPGYYSDMTKEPISTHPITKTEIIGFQIPYWNKCIDLARNAALKHPQNRSIGWDIAVTENGPGLIEGNHDWCKLVWQLPVNRGLKRLLEVHV